MITLVLCGTCHGDTIYCDLCMKPATRCSDTVDIEELTVLARKNGFVTKPGKKLSDPMLWVCPGCNKE